MEALTLLLRLGTFSWIVSQIYATYAIYYLPLKEQTDIPNRPIGLLFREVTWVGFRWGLVFGAYFEFSRNLSTFLGFMYLFMGGCKTRALH